MERAMEHAQAQGAALQLGSCWRFVSLIQLMIRINLKL
jgi:hypothetical protein